MQEHGYTAVVRVTGSVGRFEDFRERVRWLLVRDPDCDPFTEHHAAGLLEYRFEVRNGIPFPSFVEASAAFEEMRVEVQWKKGAEAGGAAIERGRMVEKWQGERAPA
jgi:hypothetical protein